MSRVTKILFSFNQLSQCSLRKEREVREKEVRERGRNERRERKKWKEQKERWAIYNKMVIADIYKNKERLKRERGKTRKMFNNDDMLAWCTSTFVVVHSLSCPTSTLKYIKYFAKKKNKIKYFANCKTIYIHTRSLQSYSTICSPMDCSPPDCPWDSPGKNTGVDCHFLLKRIFHTQRSNPCLLHLLLWQTGPYH